MKVSQKVVIKNEQKKKRGCVPPRNIFLPRNAKEIKLFCKKIIFFSILQFSVKMSVEVTDSVTKEEGVDINASNSENEEELKDVKVEVSFFPFLLFYVQDKTKKTLKKRKQDSDEWLKLGHKKPNYAEDREKERKLVAIATKGVTQLFNAVNERQQAIDEKLEEMNKTKDRSRRVELLSELKSNNFHSKLYKQNGSAKTKVGVYKVL